MPKVFGAKLCDGVQEARYGFHPVEVPILLRGGDVRRQEVQRACRVDLFRVLSRLRQLPQLRSASGEKRGNVYVGRTVCVQ